MSEWIKKPLGELLELVIDHRGKTPKKMGFDDFQESGYPVLSAKHVKTGGLASTDAIRFSNEEMYRKWMKQEVQEGDIVLTSEAPMGEAFYIDGTTKYLLGQRVFGLRPKVELIEPLYLLAWLTSRNGQKQLESRCSGSTVLGIKQSELLKIEVEVPPKDVQLLIAKNRQDLSLKIELNRQTNQTLEQVAQAIFKSWFVDFEPTRAKIIVKQKGGNELAQDLAAQVIICGAITLHKLAELEGGVFGIEKELHPLITKRFPNEGGVDLWQPQQLAAIAALFPNSMADSELGEVPEGWGAKPLGDYLEIKRGGSPRPIKDYIVDIGIPWTKIADATKEPSPFLFKTKECIREEGLNKTVFLKKGTLILSNSATPGLPKFLELDACIHDGWLHFPQKKLFSDIYLYQLFLEIRKVLVAQGNGSVFTNLKTDILRNQVVVVPSQEVIDQFDTNVALIFEALKQNCKESNTLAEIREILLPKLLSGELAAL
jgi:type I restriction enzyme, S subunit